MSKRSCPSSSVDQSVEHVDLDSETTQRKFAPVPAGPQRRVLQTYVLCMQPRVVATISLHGDQPEVRFADPNTSFIMSGTEFLQMVNLQDEWPTTASYLANTRIEPHLGGCRLTHQREARKDVVYYNMRTDTQLEARMDFFQLTVDAVSGLKTKMGVMAAHVRCLQASESNIQVMFATIVDVFRVEYLRMATCKPISHCVDELCRLVSSHIPPHAIVRDYCDWTAGSQLNHYSLLSCALAQKDHILSLLK